MKKIFIILFTLLLINTIHSQISTEHQLKKANKAAASWFNNLNSENYPGSYVDLSYEIKNTFNFYNLHNISDMGISIYTCFSIFLIKKTLQFAAL